MLIVIVCAAVAVFVIRGRQQTTPAIQTAAVVNQSETTETEEQMQAVQEAEKAQKEAEEKARLEAEEKAKKEAEEKARLEAEEKARKEAEEKARLEAEEKAKKEAEEKARREEEEKIAAEKARKEAEEKARRDAVAAEKTRRIETALHEVAERDFSDARQAFFSRIDHEDPQDKEWRNQWEQALTEAESFWDGMKNSTSKLIDTQLKEFSMKSLRQKFSKNNFGELPWTITDMTGDDITLRRDFDVSEAEDGKEEIKNVQWTRKLQELRFNQIEAIAETIFPLKGKSQEESLQALGLYHDCTEIITGDMPTPIKYRNSTIKSAYREVEHESAESLVSQLPDYMQDYYMSLLSPVYEGDEGYLYKRIVKAADKITAYIKCIREKLAGNTEFESAMATLKETIDKIDLPEVKIFMDEFIPPFGLTLDELNK